MKSNTIKIIPPSDIPKEKEVRSKFAKLILKMKDKESIIVKSKMEAINFQSSAKYRGFSAAYRKMKDGYRVWILKNKKRIEGNWDLPIEQLCALSVKK